MNLFRKLFNDPAPATWHDPGQVSWADSQSSQKPSIQEMEQDRSLCHKMIDTALASNPKLAERAHLMTDIAADLTPWIDDAELDHVMTGMRFVPTDKLVKMKQEIQNKETTNQQKALIKKTILSQGYFYFANQKIKKQLIIQPLMMLTMIGSLGYLFYGASKHNDRVVQTSAITALASYLVSDRSRKKFDKETKESRDFWKNLARHPDEMKRLDNERKKWFTPSQQNSK